jgi:rhombotail lipoprotein
MCSPTAPRVALVVCAALILSACAGQQTHRSSSVVEYLYPGEKPDRPEPGKPHLKLPLTVGIAFVPETRRGRRGTLHPQADGALETLSEAHKVRLLDRVAAQFRHEPFVRTIEVIPSTYLEPHGGFRNLDQLKSMYGLDVIALVSYDQVQQTDDDNESNLGYLTVVGMFMFNGEKNTTHTLVDTAVYDIASRKLLFRAPGTSKVKGRSKPVDQDEELRRDANRGFGIASDQMAANLAGQLEAFRQRVKDDPSEVEIEHRPGYRGGGGGGSADLVFLLIGAVGVVVWRVRRDRRNDES